MVYILELITKKQLEDKEGIFELSLGKNAKDFVNIIKFLGEIIEEIPISIDKTGIRILAADRAMVAVLDIQLKPDFFV